MASAVDDSDDEHNSDSEVLEVINDDNRIYDFSSLPGGYFGPQLAAGGISGWCVGHICRRIGLLVATAIGGGLFAVKFASDRGYIKIKWSRINADLETAVDNVKKVAFRNVVIRSTERSSNRTIVQIQRFAKRNVVMTASFGAGLLIGFSY